ncbi:MAG: sulfite exporter TauE/SafE family protein [Bacteroidota bacterium]
MILWTAFTLGLLGSLHCMGMCAPIAMALPYPASSKKAKLMGGLLYNSGRLMTYGLLGLLFGLIGKGLFIAGFQQGLCIAVGLFFLGLAFFSFNVESWLVQKPLFAQFYRHLSTKLGQLFKINTYRSLFMTGSLNGLLPCGLVYIALFGALERATPWEGMAFMIAFGLGTFPLMIAATWLGPQIRPYLRISYRRMVPVICLLFGLFFLYRGVQFHLPEHFFIWGSFSEVLCH